MKISLNKTLFFAFLVCFLLSCGEDKECRAEKNVRLGVSFYTFISDTTKVVVENEDGKNDTTLEVKQKQVALAIDSFTLWSPGVDSLLYNKAKNISSIQLPLRNLSDETEFFFLFNEQKERLKFSYDTIHNFLSFECGYLTTFKIKQVESTSLFIDSIIINLPDVTVVNAENIKIYHTPK